MIDYFLIAKLLCLIAALWLLKTVWPDLLLSIRSIGWTPIRGTIIRAKCDYQPGIFNHHQFFHQRHQVPYYTVEYEFFIDGVRHIGTRISFDECHISSREDLIEGREVTVFYSPKNSGEAVLFRSPPLVTYLVLALLIVTAAL